MLSMYHVCIQVISACLYSNALLHMFDSVYRLFQPCEKVNIFVLKFNTLYCARHLIIWYQTNEFRHFSDAIVFGKILFYTFMSQTQKTHTDMSLTLKTICSVAFSFSQMIGMHVLKTFSKRMHFQCIDYKLHFIFFQHALLIVLNLCGNNYIKVW